MASSRPSIADLRRVCQPAALLERRSAEHWAGRLYMRRVSLHATRLLVGAPVTPNALTVLMILAGLGAAAAASWPGVATAVAAALLIQAYLLLDCVDGEVARWRRTTSAAGVFLDRLGHFAVEAALVVAVGLRADDGPRDPGSWAWLGALTAVLVLVTKVQNDLVVVARAGSGLPLDVERDTSPRGPGLRGLRALAGRVPLHRILGGIELSLLLVAAAVVDAVTESLVGTRALLWLAAGVAVVLVVLHPVMILSSKRLR